MIVVEFDLQFLFVVSFKYHTSQEKKKNDQLKRILIVRGWSPRFWPFYWKQSDFDSQRKWHLFLEGERALGPPPLPPQNKWIKNNDFETISPY